MGPRLISGRLYDDTYWRAWFLGGTLLYIPKILTNERGCCICDGFFDWLRAQIPYVYWERRYRMFIRPYRVFYYFTLDFAYLSRELGIIPLTVNFVRLRVLLTAKQIDCTHDKRHSGWLGRHFTRHQCLVALTGRTFRYWTSNKPQFKSVIKHIYIA